jgi:hypothetical protein
MIETCVIAGVFFMRVTNDVDIETLLRFQDILTKSSPPIQASFSSGRSRRMQPPTPLVRS